MVTNFWWLYWMAGVAFASAWEGLATHRPAWSVGIRIAAGFVCWAWGALSRVDAQIRRDATDLELERMKREKEGWR